MLPQYPANSIDDRSIESDKNCKITIFRVTFVSRGVKTTLDVLYFISIIWIVHWKIQLSFLFLLFILGVIFLFNIHLHRYCSSSEHRLGAAALEIDALVWRSATRTTQSSEVLAVLKVETLIRTVSIARFALPIF